MSAFRSANFAAFLLNAFRNVPGLASNAMPIELATWLIMKTGKVTQKEIDASETDPGRDGRHCSMCFDQTGKCLYKVSTQVTVPGHKPSARYCVNCCDILADKCKVPQDINTAKQLETHTGRADFLPDVAVVGQILKDRLNSADPGKNDRGKWKGKSRGKIETKSLNDAEMKKIASIVKEVRGANGKIEIPSSGARVRDILRQIEKSHGVFREVASIDYRLDVKAMFTTLLSFCSEVTARYIADTCDAFAALGLPTTGLTHWVLIHDVIILSCSLDENTTASDAFQAVYNCKQGDRELQEFLAEFEGLVKTYNSSGSAILHPDMSMMILKENMNAKVRKLVVQKFESREGSAGQIMGWSEARTIFNALRSESSGKPKSGGALNAIDENGSDSDTDDGRETEQPTKKSKRARKAQRQREKRKRDKAEKEEGSGESPSKKAKSKTDPACDGVAAIEKGTNPCWLCGDDTHRAGGCLKWLARVIFNSKTGKFEVVGLRPLNDRVSGRPCVLRKPYQHGIACCFRCLHAFRRSRRLWHYW
jgi:hypothetical protein